MVQISKDRARETQGPTVHYAGGGAVAELEAKLRSFYGMRYALCVSSATAGFLCIALALNLRRKSFIAPPLTYGGSLSSWLLFENLPMFADLDPVTLTLDPVSVRTRITTETAAILAVDLFGVPCDSQTLRKIADEFGVAYIADAAQSLGALRNGRPASVDADALVVSFTAGKTICAGEGGAILTNNTDLYEKLVWHSQHPARQRRDLGLNLTNEFAFNSRIHPLAAEHASDTFDSTLRRIKKHQDACFSVIDTLNSIGLTEPISLWDQAIQPTFFRLAAAWKTRRAEKELITLLQKAGHDLRVEPIPYRLIYRQPAFLAQFSHLMRRKMRCPIAETRIRRLFCLT